MILWIAGWPHNGSTLVRQILKDSFDLQPYSKYQEPGLVDVFGEDSLKFSKKYTEDQFRGYLYYQTRKETTIVKTHEIPVDDNPAIFVIRDGRDAVTALSHFWTIPIRDAIAGQGCVFGNWSSHWHAWNPLKRPRTLLVRFEDMILKPNDVCKDLEKFLGVEQERPYVDDFEEKRKIWPQLFNDRLDCWQKEMTESDLDLFWRCHKEVMGEAGYA